MGHAAHDDLLGRLLDKVSALEGEVKALRGANTERAVEHDDEAVSRRGLLKKVGGAMAAAVAGVAVGNVLGAAPAGAADGNAVILGSSANIADHTTYITNPDGDTQTGLAAPDAGVFGVHTGTGGVGVDGGVTAHSAVAVRGLTSGHYTQTAVFGDTTDPSILG